MCIQCYSDLSNEHVLADINNAIARPLSDFSQYNSTSIAHLIYACIGINGEECQKRAKILLGLFRDWYVGRLHRPLFSFDREIDAYMYRTLAFCPNAKFFTAFCDKIIAYDDDEGRSEEFRAHFRCDESDNDNIKIKKPKFPTIHTLFKNMGVAFKADPKNFKPIIPFTQNTTVIIGKFLIGISIGIATTMTFYGIYNMIC